MSRERVVKLLLASLCLALLAVPVVVAQAAVGDTVLVSRASQPDGAGANGGSGLNLAVSAGGRFVAFESRADNLSSEDNDTVQNVFVRDTQTNVTTLVSRASGAGGVGANHYSANPAISADGRYVAFESRADNLSSEDNDAVQNVFVRDTHTQLTTLVSRATGATGVAADGESGNPSISASGSIVAFDSVADNLSPVDAAGTRDVFLRNVPASRTVLLSRVGGGPAGDADSYDPSVSAAGERIAFTSDANNLSTSDNDSVSNVFVYDTLTQFMGLASRQTGRLSPGADASSFDPSISADGRCVSFTSYAENLGGADPPTPSFTDIFVRDIQANTITFASRASGVGGSPADGSSFKSSVNNPVGGSDSPPCEQRSVSFLSGAENLSSDDVATFDVFVRNMLESATTLASRAGGELGAAANGSSFGAAMAPEGGFIAFVSEADNLSGEDNDLFRNVYLRDHPTGPPPPPPPPPDLGDNSHNHGDGSIHTDHAGGDPSTHDASHASGTAGHPASHSAGAGGHGGTHSEGSRRSGPILFADGVQDVDKLVVLATLHEPGKIVIQGTVRLGGGASKLYRFKRIKRKLRIHALRRIRLHLARSKLRAVKRTLRRGKRLRARITATASYTSGRRARTTRKIRLKP